jgi:glutathione peroxidase-family protein
MNFVKYISNQPFPVKFTYRYGSLLVHLNAAGLCNFSCYYEVVCSLYNSHKTKEILLMFSSLEEIMM